MAFIRARAPRPLWLPPVVAEPPAAKQHTVRQFVATVPAAAAQKAAVTFGNPDDIGKALAGARKARREEMETQDTELQSRLFDL
jgi:hypothetical protein